MGHYTTHTNTVEGLFLTRIQYPSKNAFTKPVFFSFSTKTRTPHFLHSFKKHNLSVPQLRYPRVQAAFLYDCAPAPGFPRKHTLR